MSTPLRFLFIVLVASFACRFGESARILAVWHMEARSHFFLGDRLMKELAARGHDVTMISPFPQKTPVKNYRDITIDGMKKKIFSLLPNGSEKNMMLDLGHVVPWKQALITSFIGSKVTEFTLEHPSVQKLLNDPKEHFDLIIFEMFHSEAMFGLAHKYDAPVIILSTIGSSVWINHLVGNQAPSSYIPDLFLEFGGEMTFLERMYNTFHNLFMETYRKLVYFPEINEVLQKHFPGAPPIYDLMYNRTAFILINSHPSITQPKPHVPAMAEIGGFHVKPASPLPKDLKEFMDNAPNGVILFSMGSNLQSTDLDENRRHIILKVFSKLKQKVIWKWEDENLPGKPDNVKIMKWCPQNDIMAHPNLKLFITHGGLLSTTEAVYHGVPVISIPIFGDQKINAAATKRKGFGLTVEYDHISEENLYNAIQEVLTQPKYKEAALLSSDLLRNQPMQPLDTAVFWVNHVLKHRGAAHLRSAALTLAWYELYSLDIIAALVLASITSFAIFYYICKKLCCRKKQEDKFKNKAKKTN